MLGVHVTKHSRMHETCTTGHRPIPMQWVLLTTADPATARGYPPGQCQSSSSGGEDVWVWGGCGQRLSDHIQGALGVGGVVH